MPASRKKSLIVSVLLMLLFQKAHHFSSLYKEIKCEHISSIFFRPIKKFYCLEMEREKKKKIREQ